MVILNSYGESSNGNSMRLFCFLILLAFLAGCTQNGAREDGVSEYIDINSIFGKAIQSKNASVCDSAVGFADRCYNTVARALNDPSLCRELPSDEPDKYTCMAGPEGEPMDCLIYSDYGGFGEDLGRCVAEASGFSAAACERISDARQREECLDDISRNVTNLTGASVCSLMENTSQAEQCKLTIMDNLCAMNASMCTVQTCSELNLSGDDACKEDVAASECGSDPASCGQAICQRLAFSDASGMDSCIFTMASTKCYNDSSYCDPLMCLNLSDQDAKNYCELWQVKSICDGRISHCSLDLCGGLDNVSLGNCESEVSFRNCVEGISRCDMQMCKSTRTESGYDDCGTGLISKLCQENSSDCGVGWCTSYSFYSQESADECVWDVFAFTGDYSRCSLIHDPDLRDLCTSRAASQ